MKVTKKQFAMVNFEVVEDCGLNAAYLLAYLDGAKNIASDRRSVDGYTYYRFSDAFINEGLHLKWNPKKIKAELDELKAKGYIDYFSINDRWEKKRYIALKVEFVAEIEQKIYRTRANKSGVHTTILDGPVVLSSREF